MKTSCRASAVLLAIMLSLAFSLPARAEIKTLAEAINKAGRQRMLSQRIVKDYCLTGMGVAKEASSKELKKSTDLFNSQLEELRAFTPTDKIKQRVEKVVALWDPFLKTTREPATKETCKALNEASEDLLAASHKLVLALADFAGTSSGKIINVSGRQRMLSQRIAKFQTMYAWDLGDSELMDGLDRATVEFQGAQVLLFQSKLNTPEIRELLIQVNRNYKPLKRILGQKKDKESLAFVIEKTEKILRDMNTVTGLYQKVAENM